MKKALASLLLLIFAVSSAVASEISSMKISGEDDAVLSFQYSKPGEGAPTIKTEANVVEVTFPGMSLSEDQQKMELESPHPLVRRATLYSVDKRSTKARIVINGSTEELKARVSWEAGERVGRLTVKYPGGSNPTLELLKEESKPVVGAQKGSAVLASSGSPWRVILLIAVILGGGAAAYFGARFLRTRGGRLGSRKFLIEQVSYCPVGPGGKSGVGIIKVGAEFVLVGITPTQISLLSQLPKLEAQYVEDSQVERGAFKAAIEQELGRLRTTPGLSS